VDRERIARQRTRLVVGAVEEVHKRLLALQEATKADELMITTMVYDHGARRRSYELLAEAFALAPQS
jgi:alkanesulfonate monooxygenase SsuD/methylene tetrahydromethanopterin reductase-like flavin-dependent oxidoreductase (luciferase family)